MLLPDYEPRHLTAIDAQGPLAIYDTCATRGPAAHLQSGPLTGLPLGECGELLAWKDGKPFNPPSAKDGRTLWKCHDRLPWLVAANDRTDSGLLSACVQASVYNMQPGMNMPPDPHEISFAHKGALGWANNPGGGFTGHFANSAENAGRLSKRNQRAHDVWTGWLVTMKVYRMKYPDWPARAGFTETREIHTYLTRAWLAWHLTGDNFWREDCHHVADFLLSKPLAEHGSTALNDPLWPYTLWMIKGDAAREWLLDAAKWYFATTWVENIDPGWTLGAIGYWLSQDRRVFSRLGPSLVNWRDSFYRAPGTPLDWVGLCPGRTGDTGSAQWPLVKAAMIHSGFDANELPKYSSLNTYPMLDGRFVNLTGRDLRTGSVSFLSTGGDTLGGRIRNMKDGQRVGEINLEGPYKSSRGTGTYKFDAECTSAQVACFRDDERAEQVFAPVSTDPSERVVIEPNAEYRLGKARGVLRTSGRVTIKPLRGYVTFFEAETPRRSVWAGKDSGFVFNAPSGVTLDARCPLNNRWTLIAEKGGYWQSLQT